MVKPGPVFSSTARYNVDITRLLKTGGLGHLSAVLSNEHPFVSATSDFRLERVSKGIVMTSNAGTKTRKQVNFLGIASCCLLLCLLIAGWINSDVVFTFGELLTEVSKNKYA